MSLIKKRKRTPKQKHKMSCKKSILGISSFLIPLTIVISIWVSLAVTPFGDHNLLVSDIGTQYLEFMSLFKHFFENGFSLYSFSNGIGGSIEALVGYYLISPFNLICLFFKNQHLPIALVWIITTKIAVMGSTMYFYLSRHFGRDNFITLVFSTSYSLCGFVVAYSLNFMWLDALIFLPLLTLGLEKLWNKETGILYEVTLFATILTNYYLGYMICLYAVTYSVYLYWLVHPEKGSWKLKELWLGWRKFFVSSLLAGVATSFILIPSLFGMLRTAKTSFNISKFALLPRFGFSALGELGFGTYQFDMRLSHLPTLYSGIFVMLLFISYFFCRQVNEREKKGSFYLMLTLFLSFIIQLLNTVCHMFQSPAGFPYRNAFIFSFLVVRFAYIAYWNLNEENNQKFMTTIGKATILFSGFLVLAHISTSFEVVIPVKEAVLKSPFLIHSLILLWTYALLLYFGNKHHRFWLVGVAIGLSFFELGSNYQQAFQKLPFGSQREFASFYHDQNRLIKQLNNSDMLWRINEKTKQTSDGFSNSYNSYNDSYLYDFSDTSSYTSTLDKGVLDTLIRLGIYSRNDRRFAYVDENSVLNLLLNVRYSIKPKNNTDRSLYKKSHKLFIYKNDESLGMGLLFKDPPTKLKKNRVIENHENILQSLKKRDKNYYRDARDISKSTASNSLTVKTQGTGEVFMYLPSLLWENIDRFYVNGKSHQTSIDILTNQLFNLGHFSEGENITIKFKIKKNIDLKNAELATLEEQQFKQLLMETNQSAFDLKKIRDDLLTGTVVVKKPDQSVFLSIPYDDGWDVYVDNKKVMAKKIIGCFLSISVPPGKHKLRLCYRPKAPIVGSVISIIVLSGVIVYFMIYKSYYKRK